MIRQEIHFYTDLSNEEQTSEYDLDDMIVDWVNTDRAIQSMIEAPAEGEVIKTTQLDFLRNAWDYIDLGIDVYIHLRETVLKVERGMSGTTKDIHPGHNILNLLTGGCFGKIYPSHRV